MALEAADALRDLFASMSEAPAPAAAQSPAAPHALADVKPKLQ